MASSLPGKAPTPFRRKPFGQCSMPNLDHAKAASAPSTYEWYRYRLQQFKDALPDQPVHTLKVYQVTDWLDKQTWSATYQAGMVTAIKRPFKWAEERRRIDKNP